LHFQLASDLVQNWIKSNPEASICTSEGVHQFKAMANFQDYHGLPQFRQVSNNENFFFAT
jgi:1-aminocyclopropane-1-carboxylate synthase